MRAEEVQVHVRKSPFLPFRVFVSDGSSYEVRHPELILVSRTNVVIAVPGPRGGVPTRTVQVDPVHSTRIDLADGSHPRKGRRRSS